MGNLSIFTMKEMKKIIIRYVCMSVARTRMKIYATSTYDT